MACFPWPPNECMSWSASTLRVWRRLIMSHIDLWSCRARACAALSSTSAPDCTARLSLSKNRFPGSRAAVSFLRSWVTMRGRAREDSAVTASSVRAATKEPRSKTEASGELTLPTESGCWRTTTLASSSSRVPSPGALL
eukprot:1792768-Prymnesium_polylepis.1